MRRVIAFACEGETLFGTVDEASGATGLLIVSGGNEVRGGAHRGMALLAALLADQGVPVFRFDRRGVGDSSGENGGYRTSRADIATAVAAFRRAAPSIDRLIGFGNCDAATALALYGRSVGLNAVVLASPWVVERADDLPPAAAIRARYAARLRDPAAWRALVMGDVSLPLLFKGLARVIGARRKADALTGSTLAAIETWGDWAHVILATCDATAIAYADAARRFGLKVRTTHIETASHSFARSGDAAALEAALLAAIAAFATS